MRRICRFQALAVTMPLFGLLAWSVALVSGQAGAPATQTPQAQGTAAANPAGTGKITGQVIAADNGAPIRRAIVTVMGGIPQASGRSSSPGSMSTNIQLAVRGAGSGSPPGMVQKQKETDAAGRFEFTGLPAGRFTVNVSGQGNSRSQTESVQLAEAGSATVTLRFERTGAITGKVLDEAGEPLPRANLRAMRWDSVGGVRRLMAAGGGGYNMTNDLGEYRLWDLLPADYFVSASYMPGNYVPPIYEREEPKFGLAPTYYPGTASMDGAQTVAVRPGQDTPGVDITLQRAKMGRVTAVVVDSAGRPMPQGGYVSITLRNNSAQVSGGMSRLPDGTFVSSDLAPGDYYLAANYSQGGSPTTLTNEGAVVPVSINGDEHTVQIQLNRGATVSGKIVVEGKMPEPMSMTQTIGSQSTTTQARVMVSARPATSPTISYFPGTSSGRPIPMSDDGTFELIGLRGSLRLMASGSRAVLKSVRRGGEDVLATPLMLEGTEHITDVEIVLTTETGTVDGTVTNSNGDPAAGAYVVIFSDDATRWFEGSPYVRQTRTPTGLASNVPTSPPDPGASGSAVPREPGRIIGGQLIAGRYRAIAFESGAIVTGPAYDPEALEKLRSRATFFTVTAGQTATVQLQTVKQ